MLQTVRTLRIQVVLLGLGVLVAGCGPSPTDSPPPSLPPPTFTPSPDGIALYSGNDCKESNVGVTDGASGQLLQFNANDRFQNDEARSLLFRKLKPGTIIRLYDDPAGNTGDDWVEILVKQEVEGYCVISFESSFEDIVIKVTFSQVNGLDGKVSLMAVDQAPSEPPPVDIPVPEATPTFTLTPTLTNTPLPPIPAIPEAACIPTGTAREVGTVTNVVDGDTIDVLIKGVEYRVRYIGMDTPERGDPYFSEATDKNSQLLQAQSVTLVKDVSETDQFGRILRYVVSGNEFVNYELVRKGFALASTYPPDVACSAAYAEAQSQAISEGAGLWAATPEPTSPPPTSTPVSSANVQITFILFDGAVPRVESDEYAQIANQGAAAINLQGWRLNAGDPGQDFYFPSLILDPGQSCRIYTNENHPEYCGFSFSRGQAIWNNKGDCGYLYDDGGALVSQYCY